MKPVEQYIEQLIDAPSKKELESLNQFEAKYEEMVANRPTRLEQFKNHVAKVNGVIELLKSKEYKMLPDVVSITIQNDLDQEQIQFLSQEETEVDAVFAQIDTLKAQIENANKEHNRSLKNQNLQANVGYNQLEEKRKILEGYSDKIFDVCSTYGITTSDVALDESMFTPATLNNLYDGYIKFMQKEESGSNIITVYRNKVSNELVQGFILLILIFLCFTTILDFVSIGFIALLVANQLKSVKRFKYYSTLMGLTFNVNPANLGFVEFDSTALLPEELTDEMMDEDERFNPLAAQLDAIEEKYNMSKIEAEQAKYLNGVASILPSLNDKIRKYTTDYNNTKAGILNRMKAELEFLGKEYERLKAEFKFLGDSFSKRYVLNTTYTLGLRDDCIEECVDTKGLNIIIKPNQDKQLMYKFIRALYVNAITKVWPGKLSVIVYDPNDLGQAVLPLYDMKIATFLEIQQENAGNILDELTAYAQKNLQAMRGKSIVDFNTECEEKGMTPIEYKLLIMLSQPKDLEENEKLVKFFDYSYRAGVFIWVVSKDLMSKNAFVFNVPFEGIQHPITDAITDEWCKKVTSGYITAIEKSRPPGLPWNEFIEHVFPEEKIWTGCADDVAEMYPGYANGDPNKYDAYTVGNQGNVHVIGVGGTGAGKSVFLNHIVATLTRQYSPKELELWLCDFKGSEFVTYLDDSYLGADAKHPYMLPHIKACLCTSDGDYATSLFKALRNIADHRYDVMSKPINYVDELSYCPDGKTVANQKGCRQWNEAWRKLAKENSDDKYLMNIWPRIIFICDEFQVIFEKADAKNLESIRADITQIAKVGRAANVHIFFTSQSMKKTLSADILQQFTLRFALRCDKEVSQEILGNSNSSDIRDKYGYLYVRDFAHIEQEDQIRYKTPFFPGDEMLYEHIHKMADRAKAEGCAPNPKDVITYREDTVHPIEELKEFYEKNRDKIPAKSGVFFLGMRMAYSPNKAPDNFILSAKNNTNIVAIAPEYNDFVLLFNDFMTNISLNEVPGTVIINSQVADLTYLTAAEEFITNKEAHGAWLSEKVPPKEFVGNCTKILEARKAKNRKDTPIWIFLLGWDKGPGFGIDTDIGLRGKITTLLQTAGEFNIHFIFLATGQGGFAQAILNACTYTMACHCSTDESMSIIGTKQAGNNYSMKNGWVFSKHDGVVTRDKLWVSPIEREIASSEIVM